MPGAPRYDRQPFTSRRVSDARGHRAPGGVEDFLIARNAALHVHLGESGAGATLENAARLHAAGVTVALSAFGSHNARNMRQGAGNAVAHGLPWEAALAAMTSHPATIFCQQETGGSLAPGKDADLVVWSGDP